jgi:hypothetical protein
MEYGPVSQPALVAVDAAQLRELTYKYVEYRQSLSNVGDPIQTLNLTGDVLEAVRRIIGLPPRTRTYPQTPSGQAGRD